MFATAAFLVLLGAAAFAAPTTRTVYVTVTGSGGAPVTDLAPADVAVKEGGKEREVAKVEPASQKMRLTLAVEERLLADTSVRSALFGFLKRLPGAAEVRLQTIGLRNTTVAEYTADFEALVGALNKLTLNPRRDSNVAEAVLEIANEYGREKPERPVLVLLAVAGGQAGVEARLVLDRIRDSGMLMYAATFAAGGESAGGVGTLSEQSGREQVLGDGPKASGGRRVDVTSTAAFAKALQQFADELTSQYAISYTLPDGVKPDRRFSISTKRRGITVRAPSAIPDR